MFTRILTAVERREIERWLRADGAKERQIRVTATRGRKFMPQIKKDLALLERFLAAYQRTTKTKTPS